MSSNSDAFELLSQGAEAKLYHCTYLDRQVVVKERFPKAYRHPSLDKSLTTQRIKAEVRCMLRCRTHGIRTPVVYNVDMQSGRIYMEHILDSQTVKDYIRKLPSLSSSCDSSNSETKKWLVELATKIGAIVATIHSKGIIHGDLTTSNILLVGPPSELQLALIDFGLGSLEATAEDKAVDLYVLERALLSSHPSSEFAFTAIINSYSQTYESIANCKAAVEILNKLEDVQQRGRKRTMVG